MPFCSPPFVQIAKLATLAIFKAILDSQSIALKDKEHVTEVCNYLAKWLATIALLVDKSIPIVAALYYVILHSEGGRQRGPSRTRLFDFAHGLDRRVPLTKLLDLN